ncbi:tripartite tricarboxylate transporter TctB family protein [Tepidamorphus sp. 3E244]|uniref:tripartite tricarboxylate transporter TctB family protein n=1 Tax=Tepidamorphus sp. 3E244 TaxID=3385498 RepID=UPI0038FC489E
MAIFLLLASIAIAIKSTELNIGWIPGRGPGAGMWPFYLALGMALSCLWTLWRWYRRTTPESRSEEPFLSKETMPIVAITVGALFGLLVGIHIIGMYLSIALFMVFYIGFVGRHSWLVTAAFAIGTPIFMFCLFEWALTTTLPKGLEMFEPFYYPLYDLMY